MTWFGQREGRERLLTAASSRLIADTEAFLSGDYANHLGRHGDAVPGWAQLNALAHGDLESLWRSLRPPTTRRRATSVVRIEEAWRSARKLLAGEILELVQSDPGTLSQVQRCVLVPLELQLMHEGDLTAFELVQSTRSALGSSMP